jgi:hypothetical protein
MRHWSLLFALVSLSGCSDAQPIDCEVVEQEVFACLDRYTDGGEIRSFFEECVPMAHAQRFRGTWATTFEYNEFYNGKLVTAEEAWQFPQPSTNLVVDDTDLEKFEVDDLANVLEVEFIGRRPICNLTDPVRDILVEKVISVRVIDERPSGW